jgi:acetylornithine deacetylase/succinyl-diaminopimelate desuccinylase-like protein
MGECMTVDLAEQESLRETLQLHVTKLAGEIGERNVFRPAGLRAAADYITGAWRGMGYTVVPQCYVAKGVGCANLEVIHEGRTHPGRMLVIGAHYDTVRGSPGADDNASGVAALLDARGIRP